MRKSERQSGHGGHVETYSLEDCQFSPSFASEQEPTCHEIDSKAVITGWEKIRHKIRTGVTESALPILQACLLCEASATMRCKQCGPKGYYCLECFLTSHSSVNIFGRYVKKVIVHSQSRLITRPLLQGMGMVRFNPSTGPGSVKNAFCKKNFNMLYVQGALVVEYEKLL